MKYLIVKLSDDMQSLTVTIDKNKKKKKKTKPSLYFGQFFSLLSLFPCIYNELSPLIFPRKADGKRYGL